MKVTLKVTAPLAIGILLSSCNLPPVEPGEVKAKWSKNMRQLGIIPVFPPREDLLVGDIYSYNYNPEDVKLTTLLNKDYDELGPDEKATINKLGMSPRFARLDLQAELSEEYSLSLSAPATSKDYNDILDNPAIAAIDIKVSEKAEEIAAFEASINKAKNEKTQGANNLLLLKQIKEDAVITVSKKNDTLTKAKARQDVPADTSDLDKQIQDQIKIKQNNEDEVAEAEFAIKEAGSDQNKLDIANIRKRKADFELAKTETTITRLQEQKNNLKDIPNNYETEQKAYDEAVFAQEEAEKNYLKAERAQTKNDEKNEITISTETKKKTTAESKLIELKDTKKSLILVGSQSLFKQPSYNNSNVFDAKIICKPKEDKSTLSTCIDQARVNRLRLVAFPEFSSTTVSQSDLSALIPAEALSLNITASTVESVSLKIPAAESYSLSIIKIFEKLFKNKDGTSEPTDKLKTILKFAKLQAQSFKKNEGDDQTEKEIIFLRIITEVYYARAFDISIFSNNSFGSTINYAKSPEAITTTDDTEVGPDDYSYFNGVINSSSPSDSGSYLSQLKGNLINTHTVPGGTVQVLHSSESTIGLRRVYDRPIAVGFRGINLQIEYSCNDGNACTPSIGDINIIDGNAPSLLQ